MEQEKEDADRTITATQDATVKLRLENSADNSIAPKTNGNDTDKANSNNQAAQSSPVKST
jgi:hypothetical protein